MSVDRARFIDGLSDGLQPVRGPRRTATLLSIWLAASWLFVTAVMLAAGPFRPGVAGQLAASPRFLLETLVGLAGGVLTIHAAIRLGIPGPASVGRRIAPALLVLAGWVLAYVYGLLSPALEPSMLGKREQCIWEVLLYGGPPLALGLYLLRRLAPFARATTGMMLGLAAGAIPGLLMQLACMYIPEHILVAHIAPNAALGVVGALAGVWVLRRV